MAIAGLILSILGIALAVVLGVLLSTGEILHRLQRNF
jgi:hypothetical protein